ncbi:MAG: TonB-dependent receptor domain-containing protein [Paludibacteraceae bacterium]
MSRIHQIALLLGLLTGTSLWADQTASPGKEVGHAVFGDKRLQPKLEMAKGNRKDTLLMSKHAEEDTIPQKRAAEEEPTFVPGVLVDVDKKIIRPQALGLSAGYTLQEILELMPELLDRGNEDMLSRYTLQMDDISVGQSKDVVLTSLRAEEIDFIEIMHSPTVSVQQNGEGGVINVHLKPIEQNFHGSAMTNVYTNFYNTVDVSPSVYFTYGSEKWQMRANMVVEYYHPTEFTQLETRVHNIGTVGARDTTTLRLDTTVTNYLQQTAKLQFDYRPTTQDVLTFGVWESMQWETARSRTFATTYRPYETAEMPLLWQQTESGSAQTAIANKTNVTAMVKYKRQYLLGGELQADVLYNYGYREDASDTRYAASDGTMLGQQILGNTDCPHEVQLNLQTRHAIAPDRLGVYDSEMWLTAGVNCSYTFRKNQLYQHAEGQETFYYHQDLGLQKNQIYASPLLQWDYRIGSVKLQAGVRYQMLNRILTTNSQPRWTGTEHDWTGSINASWAITRKHTLQLNIARNILRPEDEQLFPYPYYLPASQEVVVGNDSLHAAYFHNVGVNYLFRYPFTKEDEGRLVLHVGINYIRADGLIKKQGKIYEDYYGGLPYKTYVNRESSNVVSLSGSLFLRYRIFSMSVAGNMYVNCKTANDYYWYYNLSMSPCFAFRNQWLLSGKLMYNSKIETTSSYVGDCFYMQLRLSKKIGNWTIHAGISDIFDMKAVDRTTHINEDYQTTHGIVVGTTKQQEITIRTYDLYKRLAMVGAVYAF